MSDLPNGDKHITGPTRCVRCDLPVTSLGWTWSREANGVVCITGLCADRSPIARALKAMQRMQKSYRSIARDPAKTPAERAELRFAADCVGDCIRLVATARLEPL